ncbi:hypothetical protein B0T17DRAFT_587871 [Bombardia bombarda]|uniref:Synaptobrevin n=1 Tax=Bombardia bombarda TaxID=252184 RepID=A0AA39XP56_9PEZI|nr:hypothetical protein B0T17DRAFT_587871 [Bombardia bombarda]
MVSPSAHSADPLTDLTRLLDRLQQSVLRADQEYDARLRTSELEREKAQANILFARSLLTKLEQEALAIKIHVRKQELQADLSRKRELLDQLTEHINDLVEIASANTLDDYDDDGDDDGGSTESDDVLAGITATPSESLDSSSRSPDDTAPPGESDGEGVEDGRGTQLAETQVISESGTAGSLQQPENSEPASTITIPTIRSRRPGGPEEGTATTTATTTATEKNNNHTTILRTALFGDRATSSTTQLSTATSTTEAILDHQRAEQDRLSESILSLASSLKQSSQAFAQHLEEEREVVARAGDGMDKAGQGMEAVTRRMALLRTMTEGVGWWGRMRLYAIVYGLMLVVLLLVGVGPKFRF